MGNVVALLAVDEIVAVAAEERVGAVASENGVVAGAAVHRDADEVSQIAGGAESVVTAVHVEDELFGRADVETERRGIEPVEAHARAVGGGGEDFGAVAAVDLSRVGAVAALDEVGVVARVPDHAIVAAFAEHLVVAIAAGQRVVARAAEQKVVAAFALKRVVAALAEQQIAARAADDRVVAGAAEHVGRRQRAVAFVEHEHVVAGLAEHKHLRGVCNCRLAAGDLDRATVDQDQAGCVAADRDGIFEVVAEY